METTYSSSFPREHPPAVATDRASSLTKRSFQSPQFSRVPFFSRFFFFYSFEDSFYACDSGNYSLQIWFREVSSGQVPSEGMDRPVPFV